MQLVIGNKNWSTWSLRPWLALKRLGEPFEETLIGLRQDETPDQIAPYSPSGKVPALLDGDLTVWDSLAICEYLADKFPKAGLWPADSRARAMARSACAEMHSGFPPLRGECPMDLKLRTKAELTEATAADVRRLVRLWSSLREQYEGQGPFLLGDWSIADAYFTPVATRFRTYGILLSDYGDAGLAGRNGGPLLAAPEFRDWEEAALDES